MSGNHIEHEDARRGEAAGPSRELRDKCVAAVAMSPRFFGWHPDDGNVVLAATGFIARRPFDRRFMDVKRPGL